MSYVRWASLHRTLGLILLAHWGLLALSGALLVFHRELEAALNEPVSETGRRLDLDGVADEIRKLRPRAYVIQIATLNGDGRTVRVRIQPPEGGASRSLLFDLRTGAILGDSPLSGSARADGIFQFFYRFHQTLLLGDVGKTLVAASGLFLVANVILAYRLLWPQRRNWRNIIRPRLSMNKRHNAIQLHRAIGVVVAPFLIILGLTGAGMNWTPALQRFFIELGISAPASNISQTLASVPIGPDKAWDVARSRFPMAQFSSMSFPTSKKAAYVIRMRQEDEVREIFGATSVTVSAVDARILAVSDPHRSPIGDRMLEWMFPVHNGEIGGLLGRLMVMAAGLSLLLVCLLGLTAWIRKSARQHARRTTPIT